MLFPEFLTRVARVMKRSEDAERTVHEEVHEVAHDDANNLKKPDVDADGQLNRESMVVYKYYQDKVVPNYTVPRLAKCIKPRISRQWFIQNVF